jgi:hypothetical protein
MMTIMARFRSDVTRTDIVHAIEWLENAFDGTRDCHVNVRALGSDPRDRLLPRFTHEITLTAVTAESPVVDNAMTLAYELLTPLRPILANYLVIDSDDAN